MSDKNLTQLATVEILFNSDLLYLVRSGQNDAAISGSDIQQSCLNYVSNNLNYVSTLNGIHGNVIFSGQGSLFISQNGQIITVSGEQQDLSLYYLNTNPSGFISSLPSIISGQSGMFNSGIQTPEISSPTVGISMLGGVQFFGTSAAGFLGGGAIEMFQGNIQSYDRGGGGWQDIAINAHNIVLGAYNGGTISSSAGGFVGTFYGDGSNLTGISGGGAGGAATPIGMNAIYNGGTQSAPGCFLTDSVDSSSVSNFILGTDQFGIDWSINGSIIGGGALMYVSGPNGSIGGSGSAALFRISTDSLPDLSVQPLAHGGSDFTFVSGANYHFEFIPGNTPPSLGPILANAGITPISDGTYTLSNSLGGSITFQQGIVTAFTSAN